MAMDGQQFDDLARGLAATRSRRSVLKGVLAALVGSVAGSARAPARTLAAPGICDQRGYQACQRDARERFRLCTENCNGAFCRGADRDPDMCVGCQTNCLLIRHRDEGQCQAAGGCSAGQACCGDACVDLSTDPGNCGACGDACGEHKVCSDGSCECAAGYLNCGDGVCRDPQADQHFCGCYTDCGDCYICQDGTCTPNKTCPGGAVQDPVSCECVCPDARIECNGQCVDIDTDPTNCGTCGTTCAAGEMCVGGSCEAACPAGKSCPGDGIVNWGEQTCCAED